MEGNPAHEVLELLARLARLQPGQPQSLRRRRPVLLLRRKLKLVLALPAVLAPAAAYGADSPPEWAYPANPPGFKPKPDDGVPRRVPGSTASFTLTQLRDRFFSPVWHPRSEE